MALSRPVKTRAYHDRNILVSELKDDAARILILAQKHTPLSPDEHHLFTRLVDAFKGHSVDEVIAKLES